MKMTWTREFKACKFSYTAEAEDVDTLLQIFDRVDRLFEFYRG